MQITAIVVTTIGLLFGVAVASAQAQPSEAPSDERQAAPEQEPTPDPDTTPPSSSSAPDDEPPAQTPSSDAPAQESPPSQESPTPPASSPTPPADPTPPPSASPESATKPNKGTVVLDNGEVLLLDDVEVVEVYADRPNRPFRRDTTLRISGPALAKRGATNLADALDLLPELTVRQAGRGGIQVNIRGARKGAIKVLIDGVPVDEVYYGSFDISSIPVTDIANIRVSSTPASPIDGVGGPGGVIEVNTIDAAGARLVRGRISASDRPSTDLSATGRFTPFRGFSVRGSVSASLGFREFKVADADQLVPVDEDRHNFAGGLRLEYRRNNDRIIADGFFQHRGFLAPPGELGLDDLVEIDRELSGRFGVQGDFHRGAWRFQGHGYLQSLDRRTFRYSDPALTLVQNQENLNGQRGGGGFLINRALGETIHLLVSANLDTETADVVSVGQQSGGRSTIGHIATGAQFKKGPIALDGAVGVAIPIKPGITPWPEAKLTLTTQLGKPLTLKTTVGRKGRLPTLRERFRTDIGNTNLDPEIANFGEIELTAKPVSFVTATVAGYARHANGQIRFDSDRGQLINIDGLKIRGIDASVKVEAQPWLHFGGSYHFSDSFSEAFGSTSLDFFPRHRAEGWSGFHWPKGGARARLRYIDKQIDRDEVLPSRTSVDLSAHQRFWNNWDASVRVDNIGGKRFRLRTGGVRGDGRVFSITLQTTWK